MDAEGVSTARFYELLAWFEIHRKQVLIGVAGAAVLAIAIGLVLASRNERERQASQKLAVMLPSQMAGQRSAPQAPTAFLEVAKGYPKTAAGQRALLLAAEGLFAQGQIAAAREQFEKFRRDYPSSPFVANAAFGVAACLEAEQKADQALLAYQEVVSRYPTEGSYGQAKLALARLYEGKQQFQRALEIYNELARPNMMTAWSSEAAMAREHLFARHPELVPTNIAPATVSTPTLPFPKGLQLGTQAVSGSNLPPQAGPAGTNPFSLSLTNLTTPAAPANPAPPANPAAKTNKP